MSFFPRLSYLSLYGGELHRKGGVLLKARLSEWERELQYLRFRIAEWKEFASVEHSDYRPFRSFLLQKVRHHLHFELKTLSSILVACEVAAKSEDVPPLQIYADALVAFQERICSGSGEITRRIHLEEWHRYSRIKEEDVDTPAEMDDMFARIRAEIAVMERRSAEFKRMVDELVSMVREMREAFYSSSRERRGGGGGGFGFGFGLGFGNVNVNGSRAGRGSRLFSHFAHVPQGVTMRSGSRARPRSRLARSPSDLANSRARLPPPLPASPAPAAASSTNGPSTLYLARREEEEPSSVALPASGSVASRLWQRVAMAESAPSPSPGLNTSPSPSPRPRPPSPRPATAPRDLHQRLFHRMFDTPQGTNHHRPRTPSTSLSALALDTPAPPSRSQSGSGTGSSERQQQEQANLITEARTRLPPPLESSPIPYRPPQRLFSFLNRP